MAQQIIFLQSTILGGNNSTQVGLFDLLLTQLNLNQDLSLFESLQVVVPHQAYGIWLRDKITQRNGICANLDFVTLPGPVLQKIYQKNNPTAQLFDFSQVKYIIYDYLCQTQLSAKDAEEISSYLYANGELDKFRAYQLASQLQQIFHEYLYLRTEELIQLEIAKFKPWQKNIWRYVQSVIGKRKTFLDIYQYFAKLDIEQTDLILPRQLFIFGLTSIYPSQLQIIKKLAEKVTVYWYYQPCSHKYYGDLLSASAKSKLEKKLLRKPDLSLDDLYLSDGNPLLANLGQQSREFVELLQANEIEVYDFNAAEFNSPKTVTTLLSVIQNDIRELKYRIRPEYQLQSNGAYYASPLSLAASESQEIFDLPCDNLSLKINICHNRMREVQVMFNEVAKILANDATLKLDDILISAPDIDDYAAYLAAVFDNESLLASDGSVHKLLYSITGNRRHKNYKILETLKLILNTPYELPVNYFLELLMQAEIQKNLELTSNDITTIKKWLQDNATNFGYNESDYTRYGYQNYPVHSFKQFLNNLVLGACLNEAILSANGQLPIYRGAGNEYTPYDNLDNSQLTLANKLILLIEQLAALREFFYLNVDEYQEVSLSAVHGVLSALAEKLINDDDAALVLDKFLGGLLENLVESTINLPILNLLIDEYAQGVKNPLRLSGKITCASLQYMRGIPFKHIYVLGLNFGEFPRVYRPNQLSLLADDWYIADRNYNIEDKQTFLDTLLAAEQQLILSYIGRKETDNSEIKPSPALGLLINTLGQSFSDFWSGEELIQQQFNYNNVITQQALHPFYNNFQFSYSAIWQQVAKFSDTELSDLRWNFAQTSPLYLNAEQKQKFYSLSVKSLCDTFLYTNCNLYKVLGINDFKNEIDLADRESLDLNNRALAKNIYVYLEKYAATTNPEALRDFLELKGVLAYQHVGQLQFDYYSNLYQLYIAKRGTHKVKLCLDYELIKNSAAANEVIELQIQDEVWLEDDSLIVLDRFEAIRDQELAIKLDDLPYALKISGLVYYLLMSNGTQFEDGRVIPKSVILRQLNAAGECRDFKLVLDDAPTMLKRVLSYYLRSLTNPVLIHRVAISDYVKASKDCYKNGTPKNTPEQAREKAQIKYLADWQNNELDTLKQDPIFASHALNYFEFMQEIKGLNDILAIGAILAQLKA